MGIDPELERMARELDAASRQTISTRNEVGDAVEELFGANIRSLRTLWTAIRHPRRYAEACLTPDWQGGRYTPAVRLWLAIFSLSLLAALLREVIYPLPDENPQVMGAFYDRFENVFLLAMSFLGIVLTAVFARWNKRVRFAVNIRLMFAANIPILLFSTALQLAPLGQGPSLVDLVVLLVYLILVWLYLWRGPASAIGVSKPTLKALSYTGVSIFWTVFAALLVVVPVIVATQLNGTPGSLTPPS